MFSSSLFRSGLLLLFLFITLFVCLTPVYSKQANSLRSLGDADDAAAKVPEQFAKMMQGMSEVAAKAAKEADANSSFSLYSLQSSSHLLSIFLSPSFVFCVVSVLLSVVVSV
eukprot:GHVS01094828.1.p1 GENE.GHVS01094828.1~~GHVS01094828.1.p1  ORF type:complete len:112 (+),score=24.58 GHVS01094828.1:187-522(+)